jgi:hypothetical protein
MVLDFGIHYREAGGGVKKAAELNASVVVGIFYVRKCCANSFVGRVGNPSCISRFYLPVDTGSLEERRSP